MIVDATFHPCLYVYPIHVSLTSFLVSINEPMTHVVLPVRLRKTELLDYVRQSITFDFWNLSIIMILDKDKSVETNMWKLRSWSHFSDCGKCYMKAFQIKVWGIEVIYYFQISTLLRSEKMFLKMVYTIVNCYRLLTNWFYFIISKVSKG